MKGIDLTGHYALQTSDTIAEICLPLRKLRVTYFMYIKIYQDGSREILTTHAPWLKHFYKHALYLSQGVIDLEYLLPKGYFLWSELTLDDPVYKQAKELFDIDNGITFINKNENCTLLYIFSSSPANPSINQFYLRNISLLKHFILYFNYKAEYYIKESKKHRIYLPLKQNITSNDKVMRQRKASFERKKEFLKSTKIRRFYLFDKKNTFITNKQAEYAIQLVGGHTDQGMAQNFNVSYHTIRTQIRLLKKKMVCSRKADLMKCLKDSIMFDLIFDVISKNNQNLKITNFSEFNIDS